MSTTVAAQGLRAQVDAAPGTIRAAAEWAESATRLFLPTPDVFSIRSVALVGSGDSMCASMAAAATFAELLGVPVAVQDSMTAARYPSRRRADARPLAPLVIVVSASGEVTRSVEAAYAARATGSRVVALTTNPQSRLAAASDTTLLMPRAEGATGPALSGTLISIIALAELAIRWGEVVGRYTMDEADALRREIPATADGIEAVAEPATVAAELVADRWRDATHVTALGSGPSRSAAAYASAKIIEASGLGAHHQDFEEFLHLDYFVRDRSGPVLATVGSTAASHDRAAEVIAISHELGRPVAAVTDAPLPGALAVPHAPTPRELWHPLAQLPSLAAVAAAFGDAVGEEPFRGSEGPWAPSRGAAFVRNGTPRSPKTGGL